MPATPYKQKTQSYAENCESLSFQSFLSIKQGCFNEVLFIQGAFNTIQGLLGKIQGLFKDFPEFFNFQGLFKGLTSRTFQGLCEPCDMIETQHF